MKVQLSNTPVIETERLTMRAPQAEDYPHWESFAVSERARYIGGPYTEKTAWRAFGYVIGHWVLHGWGSFVFTLKKDTKALGLTGPWFPKGWPEKELGWTIWHDDLEGTGLMYEAACAGRDYAFGTLGWPTAVSYIDEPNRRSIALAERLGASRDDAAPGPAVDDEKTVLVYRHPNPRAQT